MSRQALVEALIVELYDQLLRELAAKASGVPIGTNPPPARVQQAEPANPGAAGLAVSSRPRGASRSVKR
jgi:hypothetical protein